MLLSRLWQCREPFIWLHDFAARRRVMHGTREQLQASHDRRFRRLVRFVAKQSPYYSRIIRERKIDPRTCRLEEFPILTRQMLIERFDEITTDRSLSRQRMSEFFESSASPTDLLDNRYFAIHSAGTSGNRVYMAYSPREWIRGVSHQTRFAGGLRWRKRCAFIGLLSDHFGGYTMAMTAKRGINRFFFDTRGIDLQLSTQEIVDQLNDFQPHVLSAYSSVLAGMADQQANGQLQIRPQCIVSSGEMLQPEQRRYIEAVFGLPVTDVYAATEVLVAAMAGAPGDVMTLLEDDLILEFNHDHYCATSLFHRTVPLIRYRMEDALRPVPQTGSHPLRRVGRVVGRSCELMMFLNNQGEQEPIHSFVLLALHVRGVVQYQFVYQGMETFAFRVRFESGLTELQRGQALEQVHSWLQQTLAEKGFERSVRFTVDEVDRIPADPRTGKVRMVIDEQSQRRAA